MSLTNNSLINGKSSTPFYSPGSLLVGILLRNVPGIDVAKYIDNVWSTKLRNMALGIILGRAGLEVDKKVHLV